jgi:hypothetical protein
VALRAVGRIAPPTTARGVGGNHPKAYGFPVLQGEETACWKRKPPATAGGTDLMADARKPVVSLTLRSIPRYYFCFRLMSMSLSLGRDVRVIIR